MRDGMAIDMTRLGRNGKNYEDAFSRFRDEVLDVLDMKRTDEKFKHEVLGKTVVWHPTGFFGVRHRTPGAATSRPGAKLNRDHVYTRRFLVDQILLGANLRDIFEMAGTLCYVTPKEHERLARFAEKEGWDRYHAANIEGIEEL
jgi:hypothetical protein